MGCGASSVQIAPTNDNELVPTLSNNNNNDKDRQLNTTTATNTSTASVAVNGYPKVFKFALFQRQANSKVNAVIKCKSESAIKASIAVQTESDINGIKTQYTQTDIILLPDEELELIMRLCDDRCDDISKSIDHNYDYFEVNKSVLLQTEDTNRRRFGKQKLSVVTVDVGIQVKNSKTTRATQTSFGSVGQRKVANTCDASKLESQLTRVSGKHNRNIRGSMSVDADDYKLWSTPTKFGALFDSDTLRSTFQDIESQTEPLVTTVLAANSAGNDLTDLSSCDMTSPFAHIERELLHSQNHGKHSVPDPKLQNYIALSVGQLLDDMDDAFNATKTSQVRKCDASVQTDNDPLTDESPEFAARPPPCRKREMIPSLFMFKEIDKKILEAPPFESLQELVDYICRHAKNDLFKVRGIFRWITNNIKYDWKYLTVTMTSIEILKVGEGVCKDYCQLFEDLCRLADIRVKKIEGFAKGHDYRPGHQFKPGEDITHTWNAVFLLSAWRLLDTTWGTGFTDHTGKFQQKLNEHFFLTDPEVLIWTHFPHNDIENSYSRWQLLDKPINLDQFNSLPKVAPYFFDFNLKIRSKPQNPVVFRISTEIKIGAHEPMRYKYKLYPSEEMENSSLNHYVFCQLKEDRLVGSFAVTPPIEGTFYLKIFAKPEREMQEGQDSTSLQNVITLLLECTRARKYIEPLPINELPWGPTQSFYDFKMRLHNQTGPIIATWGGRRRLVMEANETMLITYSLFDADGMEMDTRGVISRDDSGTKTTFTINPPRVGAFKFMIFGMPKPKQKGKWRLPLLATFMIDCKLIRVAQYDDDPPAGYGMPAAEEPKSSEKRKMRPMVMR